jgi:Tetratricopeptide repeat
MAICGLLPALLFGVLAGETPDAPSAPESSALYAGSAACSRCHSAIYRSYVKTAMGRSMASATNEPLPNLSLPAQSTNAKLDRHFDVFTRDGKLFESEYAIAPDLSEIFRDTRPMEWLIGAGVNGFGPVVEQDHYLFQAPLSFYTKPRTWGPSPGYEALDLGFNRPILAGCIFCHSGRANPVAGANGQYADPAFSELSIGCENCHGPGKAHIQAMGSAPGAAKGTQIVNPSRLTPYMANNICMACHQTGDVRVLQPGKTYRDIRPGQPLDETLKILIVPPTPESPPDVDHVEHYYSMTLSKCYRSSAGRMSCISCHDPHMQPTAEEAPAYYAAKCLKCHTNKSCQIPLDTRLHRQPSNDCAGCHMPKRDIQVISHSSATNHRILARPDEPFPDITFHQTTSVLPDLIDLDPAPGRQNAALPSLTLLQAYGELAAEKPQYVAPYLAVLASLEKSDPDNALVQAAVGRREVKSGNFAAAVEHLQRALSLAPPQATTCADLADALTHLDRKNEAVTWLDKSIQLDPFNPFTQRTLIVRLIELKNFARARAALEHYVEVFPQDTFMRQMLAKARAQPVQ